MDWVSAIKFGRWGWRSRRSFPMTYGAAEGKLREGEGERALKDVGSCFGRLDLRFRWDKLTTEMHRPRRSGGIGRRARLRAW